MRHFALRKLWQTIATRVRGSGFLTIFVHVHLRLRLRQRYYGPNRCAPQGSDMGKRAVRLTYGQYVECETYPFLPRGPVRGL
jgi:hypothetical protein